MNSVLSFQNEWKAKINKLLTNLKKSPPSQEKDV